MSTRAVYSIYDDQTPEPINIYIHCDGYPMGAADHIREALPFAWKLPRFEADEFAAAMCAGCKSHYLLGYVRALETGDKKEAAWFKNTMDSPHTGGNARIFRHGPPIECEADDLAYRYEIRCLDGRLYVKAFSTDYWSEPRKETEIFTGSFVDFDDWAKREAA